MKRIIERSLIWAGFVLAVAAVVFAVTLVQALTLDTETNDAVTVMAADAPVASPAGSSKPRVPSQGRLDPEALRLAVDHDPFHPERRRADAYVMPGERVEREAVQEMPPPPPPFRLLGTVDTENGGVAVMQVEDSPPRVLTPGESMMGYRLEEIDGVMATLSGQGRLLTITVADAAPHRPEPRRASRGGRRGDNDAEERARQQRLQALRNLVEQMRARGMDDELIQRMVESMERRIESSFEFGAESGPNRGRIILRGRAMRADTMPELRPNDR